MAKIGNEALWMEDMVLRNTASQSEAMRILLPLAFFQVSLAFQFPFKIPQIFQSKAVLEILESATIPVSPRIAVIGAGAGGTSAAFWISKAKERLGLDIEVDIYDKAPYVGGRKYCSKLFASS